MTLVHTRIIAKEAIEKAFQASGDFSGVNAIIYEMINQGLLYVQRKYPEAKYRVGCMCCYGDGPNIEERSFEQEDGSWRIDYDIDFDWKLEDHL